MDQQLDFWAGMHETAVEREALVRGALYNAGLAMREVARVWIVVRQLIEADGDRCPPSIEDLAIGSGESPATVKRRLALLRECGILATTRDEGSSARDPLRRGIDWEATARLARRPLAHHEPTKGPSAHGEPTRSEVEPTKSAAVVSSKSIDPLPSPKGSPLPFRRPVEAVEAVQVDEGGSRAAAEWLDVEREAARAGVGAAKAAIDQARGRGASPELVRAIVEHFRSTPGAWGPGALQKRIASALPGVPACEGWPRADAAYDRERAAVRRSERQEADRRKREAEAEQRAREAVETEVASAAELRKLATMADGEIVELLERSGRRAYVRQYRALGRDSPLLRSVLVEALAESATQIVVG